MTLCHRRRRREAVGVPPAPSRKSQEHLPEWRSPGKGATPLPIPSFVICSLSEQSATLHSADFGSATSTRPAVSRSVSGHSWVRDSWIRDQNSGTIDANRDVVITGTITGVEFVNPHSWLDLEGSSDGDSTVAPYHCEMRPATGLLRSGWTPEMFVVGEAITVEASPDRVDPTRCYVATLIFSDGTRLDRYEERSTPDPLASVGDRPLRLPNGDPNISGNWAAELYVLTDPRGQRGAFVSQSVAATVGPGGMPVEYRPMPGVRGWVPRTILAALRAAVASGPVVG